MDYVVDNAISLFFVTETWLTDLNNHTTAVIKSYGFDIRHHFRSAGNGGGVAIIFKPYLKVIKVSIKHSDTFETIAVKTKLSNNDFLLCCCVYRTGPLCSFIDDFDAFLSDIFPQFDKFLFCGDLNIHLDETSKHSTAFCNVITSYGLFQHVNKATHKAGHTLDVIISSHQIIVNDEATVKPEVLRDFPTCDHYPIHFVLANDMMIKDGKKEINFRNLKSIDVNLFKSDFIISLSTEKWMDSFSESIIMFNAGCEKALNTHAPMVKKTIRELETAPWFDSEYKQLRIRRRKSEKQWRKNYCNIDKTIYDNLRQECIALAKSKEAQYYKSKFEKYNHSQKSLYKFAEIFLDRSPVLTLPPSDDLQTVVDNFNSYFTKKIDDIRNTFSDIPAIDSSRESTGANLSKLERFTPATIDEIRSIIEDTGLKTSTNDPLPQSIIKEDIEFWLPYICDLVNCSLSSGSIEGAKLAHLTPLIKGKSLDPSNLKNYRPISNLSFIGKLIERVVLKRMNDHMAQNNLNMPFQSAYKKHHSTETLMIRIVNDLLITIDEKKATVVMLLDLSAAFDTVDHNKLLHILKSEIGIVGTALDWFRSFLCGRCQRVHVGGFESAEIIIRFGVPQGSVLGPVLFNIYIRSLYNTVHNLNFNIHGFADDHQVFKSFNMQHQHETLANQIPEVFSQITKWMTSHFLLLNPGKTEIIVFGSQSTLLNEIINGTFLSSLICIRFVSTVKNLGIRLDSNLNFKNQITTLKSSCYHKLRNLAKMKPHLSCKQLETLTLALVISSLDYCNSLYHGINVVLLDQLQSIQNRACRVILGLKRREPTSTHMKKLHWLKVKERIEFKVLLLVYKTLSGNSPSYLTKLINYNCISGSRTPSLSPSFVKTSVGKRAFQHFAPILWNSIPNKIKHCEDISSFKKLLKTYLFEKSYIDCQGL